MPNITTITNEPERGCGFRKEEGLYLVAGGKMAPCGKLPIPLNVCPCCGAGIKFSRSWTWMDPRPIAATKSGTSHLVDFRSATPPKNGCLFEQTSQCMTCPFGGSVPERVGLLWVGEATYKTPAAYMDEAARQGISRRIKTVPRNFRVGETWVFLAHIKAMAGDPPSPGIFTAFKPERIEYIVGGEESMEALQSLEDRGITLVKLVRTGKTTERVLCPGCNHTEINHVGEWCPSCGDAQMIKP